MEREMTETIRRILSEYKEQFEEAEKLALSVTDKMRRLNELGERMKNFMSSSLAVQLIKKARQYEDEVASLIGICTHTITTRSLSVSSGMYLYSSTA